MKIVNVGRLRALRRLSQAVFLILFVSLVFHARYSPETINLAAEELIARTPLTIFFRFDPLLGFSLMSGTRLVHAAFLLGLITLGLTLLFGRFFCGWVCPFGTLHQMTGSLRRGRGARTWRRYTRWQSCKYYLLIVLLIAGAAGLVQTGIFDPLCILARSCLLALFPGIHQLAHAGLIHVIDAGPPAAAAAAGRLFDFLEAGDYIGVPVAYRSAMLTGAVFLALILPNLLYPRFWCRFLCPLGALLGLTARCAPLAMRKGQIGCMLCGKCLVICQGGGSPEAGTPWRKSECLLCMNCQGACPGDLLGFEWLGISDAIEPVPDLTRRGVILSIGAGLCTLPLARLLRRPGRGIIRPPGSLPEGDFLAACLRCGTCTRICPTSAIHPSILEAGISGFWAPRLIPRIGYCVYSCTLCGQVCPSHAIGRLSLEEKMGSARMRPWKLGTAVVDRARCIPWAKGMQCIACEEVCPVSPKAVRVDEAKVTGPEGFAIMLGRPVIDQIACIGCGHCEHVCPVEGPAAIRVYGTRD